MLETIKEAATNFCIHQLGTTPSITQLQEIPSIDDSITTSLEIIENEQHYNVYFTAQKDFIQFIASIFLDEESSDKETLEDMALECINLIVGNAKVIGSTKNKNFTIATPKLINEAPKASEYLCVSCNEYQLYISIQMC